MSIGKIIKFLRHEHGLTQQELADLLGVKKSSIQKYEANDVPNLKVSTIRTLSDTFNISPTAFIFPEKYRQVDLKTTIQNHKELEKHHLILLRDLNENGRKKVFEYTNDLKHIEIYQNRNE